MNSKKKKLYAAIALLAVLGLLASSISSIAFRDKSGSGQDDPQAEIQQLINELLAETASLKAVVADDPDNAEKIKELGGINLYIAHIYRIYLGDEANSIRYYGKAVEYYQKGLEIDPSDNDARIDMATAALYGKQIDLAENNLLIAIENDPKHPEAYFYYGILLYYELDETEKAIEKWEYLLSLEEEFNQEEYPDVGESIFLATEQLLQEARSDKQ